MKILTAIDIVTFSIICLPIYAQTNVVGRMEVEISVPVTAAETNLLNFGKVLPETGGGNVRISPDGLRTAGGNITVLDDKYSAGKFIISAMPNSLVSIILPQTPQKMTLADGSSEITVNDFDSDVPIGGQVVRQSDGKAEISIGATLYIGNGLSNPAGYYSGTYEVIFMYN